LLRFLQKILCPAMAASTPPMRDEAAHEWAPGCGLLALSGSCLTVLFYSLNRRGWSVWR